MSLSREDTQLRDRLRRWLDAQPRGVAELTEKPASPGGYPLFVLTPAAPGACAITLWVGDGNRLSASLDVGGAWWDWLSDAPGYLEALCDAVAGGHVLEQTRCLGGLRVARQVTLSLQDHKPLRHAVLSPFLFLPFPKWNNHASAPWMSS